MTRHTSPGYLRRSLPARAALLLAAGLWAAAGLAGGAAPAPVSGQPRANALDDPFRGVTANGQPVFGLFPVAPTGVATEPLVAAAGAFLGALRPEQQRRARLPVNGPEWREWDPHGGAPGHGVRLAEMSAAARGKALELLQVSLSARGYELAAGIVAGDADGRGPGARSYSFAVLGEPSPSEPWGWQLAGDHLVINYFVQGDQVVMSPVFLGWEAPADTSGPAAALREQGEETLQALSDAQRRMARMDAPRDGGGIVAGAHGDNAILDNVGIPASLMDSEQRARLLDLVERYVGILREAHAAVKMAEVEEHLDSTYFAWLGDSEAEAMTYYRIFSPVVLVEVEWQPPAAGRPAHVHAVLRTPNGNDYGKALLSQHLIQHPSAPKN